LRPADADHPEKGISLAVGIREPAESLARKYCEKSGVKTFYILLKKKL